ncbi:phage portal protein [Bradyrhizobium sp. STM 3809]|uniref:phage portal protein n=1 Tax=Bradyrhizobium sp. STM 3809 TaxID=551936 RepID=UPI000240930C|nr:phage portal protein [Bradyrhizobium sp. STM 3809]CCE01078.1 putative Phage portal protein, lambda [Bradyrhizobium sp. STM 3809]
MLTSGYGPFFGTPGSEISRERSQAAAVTLDLLTSNSTIATLCETLATYAIGSGLTLSSKPDHEALGIKPEAARSLSHQIERAWLRWVNNAFECDASGRHKLHQLATGAFKSWLLTGESVVALDWRRSNATRTATKVKLLDSRQLDQSVSRKENGGSVLQGVAFDALGRLRGYYLRESPLGDIASAPQAVFVPARTSWGRPRVLHLFDLIAPGQVRGLSPLIAALSPAHSKGSLREFSLAQALVQSMIATTITSDLPTSSAFKAFEVNDGLQGIQSGANLEQWMKSRSDFYLGSKVTLQPGGINHLPPGDKMTIHRSEAPNSAYDAFDRSMGREAAKAAGSSYEDISGDYSTTSFSASRLALELPARVNKRRRGAIVEPFYQGVFSAWLEEQIESGVIALPKGAPAFWQAPDAYTAAAWRGEGKPIADPFKDVQAAALRLQNGLTTLEAELAERGLDLEEVIAQRVAEREMLEAAGLSYTSAVSMTTAQPDNERDVEEVDPLS